MNYKKYNDYELIYMVRENDDNCRDILFLKYQPVIHNIANDYYKRFSKYGYDYDDFVQEASIAFQRALLYYDENKDTIFYSFVVLCIKRSLLTFCRQISNSNKNISCDDTYELNDDILIDTRSNLSDFTESMEVEEIYHNIILDLPIDLSSIFELKINGFTFNEIGVLLDIPSSTAEYKNRFARIRLKRCLHQYYSI